MNFAGCEIFKSHLPCAPFGPTSFVPSTFLLANSPGPISKISATLPTKTVSQLFCIYAASFPTQQSVDCRASFAQARELTLVGNYRRHLTFLRSLSHSTRSQGPARSRRQNRSLDSITIRRRLGQNITVSDIACHVAMYYSHLSLVRIASNQEPQTSKYQCLADKRMPLSPRLSALVAVPVIASLSQSTTSADFSARRATRNLLRRLPKTRLP